MPGGVAWRDSASWSATWRERDPPQGFVAHKGQQILSLDPEAQVRAITVFGGGRIALDEGPAGVVRELRKLFAQYCALNRQITRPKNNAQAILVDNGVELKKEAKGRLYGRESGLEVLKELNISAASRMCLEVTPQVLWRVEEAKGRLAAEILLAGEPLRSQVELLISIKGVTPLFALASMADVADVQRFRTVRKMNAYLGLVPRAKNSGGKERAGHITRESRKLTRTILIRFGHHDQPRPRRLDSQALGDDEKDASQRRAVSMHGPGVVPEEAQAVRASA